MRTRPLEQALELLRNGSISSSFSDGHTCFRHKVRVFATRLCDSCVGGENPTETVASITRANAEREMIVTTVKQRFFASPLFLFLTKLPPESHLG